MYRGVMLTECKGHFVYTKRLGCKHGRAKHCSELQRAFTLINRLHSANRYTKRFSLFFSFSSSSSSLRVGGGGGGGK